MPDSGFDYASNIQQSGIQALFDVATFGATQGISYGFNAKAASTAHDRNKNMITRRWLYEQIALREAKINPGYIFANTRGAAGQAGSMKAPQAGPSQGIAGKSEFGKGTQLENTQANTALQTTQGELVEEEKKLTRAKASTELERARSIKLENWRSEQQNNALNTPEGMQAFKREALARGLPKGFVESVNRWLSGNARDDLSAGPLGAIPGLSTVVTATSPMEVEAGIDEMADFAVDQLRYQGDKVATKYDENVRWFLKKMVPTKYEHFVDYLLMTDDYVKRKKDMREHQEKYK